MGADGGNLMRFNHKGFATIIAIIIAVLVVGGLVYWAIAHVPASTRSPNLAPLGIPTPQTPTPSATLVGNEILHKDSFNEVTFEFKLPSDFQPEDVNLANSRGFTNNKYSFGIYIYPNKSPFSLEKTLADLDAFANTIGEGGPAVLSKKNVTVDGLSAIQRKENTISNPFSTAQVISTYLLVNQHLVNLIMGSKIDTNPDPEISSGASLTEADAEFYGKILPTFKFTK